MKNKFPSLTWISQKFISSSLLQKIRSINLMDLKKITPTYYFEDVYRYVETYHHTYRTFTKKRWINMKIIEMFTKEFQAYDYAYYV